MLRYLPKDEIYIRKVDIAFSAEAATTARSGERWIVLDGDLPTDLDESVTREIERI